MVPHMPNMISFHSTEPSDLLPGSSWGMSAEGTQHFQDYTDNGSCHSGEAEDYTIVTSGHTTPRGTKLDRSQTMDNATWSANGLASSAVSAGTQAMSRVNSCRSNRSSLSRSSQLSNMDMRGNAAFRNGSQASQTMVAADCIIDPDTSAIQQQNPVYWTGYQLNTGLNVDCTPFPFANASPLHIVPSQIQFGPDASIPEQSSPGSWASFSSSISRTSSPATDDAWFQGTNGLTPSSSPELPCQSPLIDIKDNILGDDMTAVGIQTLGDALCLPPTFPRRDGETARSHDLYRNASPGDDGLYHCPWEGESCCNHKPEKLKCNYDKFVDSHLKPYRCKAEACEGARFSSTACLLRHEREAHGLHGHGDKPFLCQYDGCERGVPGNGFPRQWNLKDHMKRVHNDPGSSGGSPPAVPAAAQPSKGRKRKSDSSDNTTSRKSSHKHTAKDTKVQTKPLLAQWLDHRHAVEELIRSLNKPEDVKSLHQISEMKKLLDDMTHMTSGYNHALSTDMPPHLAGPHNFVGTG